MTTASGPMAPDLRWMLDDLVDRVGEVRHVLLLSGDGLVAGASKELSGLDAEHLAAVASGFHSLAKATGRHFGSGAVSQSMVEFEQAFLFVTAAGDGSCLAVISGHDADPGVIAYEMVMLVKRVGEHLGAAPRSGTAFGADRGGRRPE
ncbi:roadblock/LC7 domain-containing protein [Streptomyces sp. NPDC058989]|uniref:roadblock/LC7 domain-containing protein n=1 Tax=Streptomyces sp. NPDC058989 TaxID=3346686 RepID=UPI0036A9EC85